LTPSIIGELHFGVEGIEDIGARGGSGGGGGGSGGGGGVGGGSAITNCCVFRHWYVEYLSFEDGEEADDHHDIGAQELRCNHSL
jgi:hypothetical protein